MSLMIYNTASHREEEFKPWNSNQVTMYTCGPTVYHFAHIGNLRTYIMEDILEKTLRYLGYNVKRCMNITDVGHLTSDADSGDDKMVSSAKKEHKTVMEIAKFYTDKFFDDCDKLNIKKPELVCPATKNIDEYIKIIEKLLKDGYAYERGGNVYFDTSKLDKYYVLTNHEEENLLEGVRDTVDVDTNKKNKTDFVLWFTKSKFDTQDLKWDSPFGVGYPGWHIECTGISIKYLGEHLDIHCGGVDNIFPHHTNEIAQSEAYLGHKWCNYWVHGEHLNDKSGKMSKSKGEFLTVSLLEEKGYNPLSYRFMCLQSHYRSQLVFSYDSLETAQSAYLKLKSKVKSLNKDGELNMELINKYDSLFKNAISDDLNTSNALTILFDLLKDDSLNSSSKLYLVEKFDSVFSLDLVEHEKEIDSELLSKINELIDKRNAAKKDKDYALADSIRDELKEMGVVIKDTREGTTFEII